ncbi:MAG: glycosyltransferase family 2 protein [Halieaceae bacterium]|jgi:GT2 family glycosyltransferase|nr:glycosyltransferase family 2 protein [Halieaceae bacterium]
MEPTVSICVANYNGAELIGRCLDSIYAQNSDATIEILVHDDASDDDSVAIVSRRFPDVRLLSSADNVGFCRANNKMVAAASGTYVLLLNNDAWLAEDAVETLLRAQRVYGESILTLPQFNADDERFSDCGMFMDVLATPMLILEKSEQPVATVMGSCLWLSRALWDQCGGFPPWFGSIAEDMYLCNYARILGYPVVALSHSAYYHHVGHSFGGGKVVAGELTTTIVRRRLSERNKLYVMFLFYPLPLLLLVFPLQLSLLAVEGMVLAIIKRRPSVFTRIYGHALWAFVLNLPDLAGRRREVQARRVIGNREYLSVFRWFPHKLRMLMRHGIPKIQ